MISDFVSLCESQSFLLWNKNDLLPKYFFFTTSKMETVSPRGILPRPPFLVDFGDLSLSHVKLTHPHAYTHTLTRTHAHTHTRTHAHAHTLLLALALGLVFFSSVDPSVVVSWCSPGLRPNQVGWWALESRRRGSSSRSPGWLDRRGDYGAVEVPAFSSLFAILLWKHSCFFFIRRKLAFLTFEQEWFSVSADVKSAGFLKIELKI